MKVWGKPLDYLEFLVSLAKEFGDLINEKCREEGKAESSNLIEALTRLFARICQVSSEVLTLLKNGFADGAMARWRTVHELFVVSSFIRDNGEEIAERYFFHNDVESFKAAIQYQKYCKALGYKRLSKKELKNLTDSYESAIARYGSGFKVSYGWAVPALKNPRPTFATIEESVELDHFRPLFKLASQNVHGGPKGILNRLGMFEGRFLLTGPSDIGLGDPGINTAISLSQAASNLFDLVSTLDCLIWMKSLRIISLDTQKAFLKVEEKQNHRLVKNIE